MFLSKINNMLIKHGFPSNYVNSTIKDNVSTNIAQMIVEKEKAINLLTGNAQRMWEVVIYLARLSVINKKTISLFDYKDILEADKESFLTIISGCIRVSDEHTVSLRTLAVNKAFKGTPLILMAITKDFIKEVEPLMDSIQDCFLILEV